MLNSSQVILLIHLISLNSAFSYPLRSEVIPESQIFNSNFRGSLQNQQSAIFQFILYHITLIHKLYDLFFSIFTHSTNSHIPILNFHTPTNQINQFPLKNQKTKLSATSIVSKNPILMLFIHLYVTSILHTQRFTVSNHFVVSLLILRQLSHRSP